MSKDHDNRIRIDLPSNQISVTFHYGGEALTPSEQREVMDEMADVANEGDAAYELYERFKRVCELAGVEYS